MVHSRNKRKSGEIGKKVYAYDPKGMRNYRNIGVVKKITKDKVFIFNKDNPKGYQKYSLSKKDFDKWVSEKKYKLR